MKIDAHHHFWQYSPAEYDWIGDSMGALKHDFLPAELKPHLAETGIDGVISVQARSDAKENTFLLTHARRQPWIKGVVGWVDLTQPRVAESLERYTREPLMVGLREVLQGKEDPAWCLREDFNRGIALLHDFGLTYDVLIYHHQMAPAIEFVDRHPNQIFVLDHLAKPAVDGPVPAEAWAKHLRELAKREHVYCKVSGLVTEITSPDLEVTSALLHPYFEIALEAFGPKRLMFGSDWPVSLLRSAYVEWFQLVESWVDALSPSEKARILGGTAVAAYHLA